MEKTEKFTYLKIREAKLTENKNTYVVEGYATTWNNEYPVFDWIEDFGFIEFYESFERGAFAKSINARAGKEKKNSIKMLYQHDRKQVLGTPTLEEDEIGLKFHWEMTGTGRATTSMPSPGGRTSDSYLTASSVMFLPFRAKARHTFPSRARRCQAKNRLPSVAG